MNLHPLLVHFPIALLTIYAVLELASVFKPVRARPYVFHIKAALLIVGWLASVPTYVTGYIQLGAVPTDAPLYPAIIMHFYFATTTVLLFFVLALAYAAEWLLREWTAMPERFRKPLGWSRALTATVAAPLLALVGLVCVTVTGALGGGMVYGPDVDPAVKFIYSLLVR